jgi:hypothetical protein
MHLSFEEPGVYAASPDNESSGTHWQGEAYGRQIVVFDETLLLAGA